MKDEGKKRFGSSSLSKNERQAVWLLACVGFLSRVALLFRSEWKIASRPYIEDAFYSLSCARQLALGHGFSVDGVHPTNGVQPLICLLNAPCFWLTSDRWVGVRLTFIIAGLIQFFSVLVIARLLSQLTIGTVGHMGPMGQMTPVGRTSLSDTHTSDAIHSNLFTCPPVIGAFLWVILAPLLVHNMNGLETGLYALLILCSLSFYQSVLRWTAIRAITFGVLLGLVVLARIDGVLLVASFAMYELFRSRGKTLGAVIAFGVIAIAVSAPWWLYNYNTFGSLMPISGQSETLGLPIAQNLLQSAAAIFDMLTLFFYHRYYEWSAWLTVASFLLLSVVWLYAIVRARGLLRVPSAIIPLGIFALLLLLYYNFFFSAPHFIARYLHPMRILVILVFAACSPRGVASVQRWMSLNMPRKRLVFAALVVPIAFSLSVYAFELVGSANSDLYRIGLWAKTQPGRIGMEQSGTAGFIAANVVNLDGKVNPDALRARKAGRIGEYIAGERFEYLADWELVVKPLVRAAQEYGAEYRLVDSVRYVLIYKRVEANSN